MFGVGGWGVLETLPGILWELGGILQVMVKQHPAKLGKL